MMLDLHGLRDSAPRMMQWTIVHRKFACEGGTVSFVHEGRGLGGRGGGSWRFLRNSGISHKLHHGSNHIGCGPMRKRFTRAETEKAKSLEEEEEDRSARDEIFKKARSYEEKGAWRWSSSLS